MLNEKKLGLIFVATILIWFVYHAQKSSHKSSSKAINLSELNYVAKCLLIEAGQQVVELRRNLGKIDHKADRSVVTKADLASHNIFVHSLRLKFPQVEIRSEESDEKKEIDETEAAKHLKLCDKHTQQWDDKWSSSDNLIVYIDPLDATQEYSENLLEYVTVMYCLVDSTTGYPRAGSIYKPFTNEMFSSFYDKGKNATRNDIENQNRVVVSRSHAGSSASIIEDRFQGRGEKYEMITAAGAGYKTVTLLENKSDVYFHSTKIKRWDLCAPDAILRGEGGKLTKRDGKLVDYVSRDPEANVIDGIIASLHYYPKFYDIFNDKK